ncbi:GL22211 [Drosophila persimilis]|uniref:Protein takeout n=2 Tax=pseudoobscura subgroup TaxID=32358 RepID=A0A6I8UR66_DROPS|nr:protein takeout [Drosophila pseudoobscura]XP_002017256.1 protein takeout [Drosophila persimilis]XP_017145496.1 protein takeout [Drosophila miranda]EDW34356.1 GL22211 [Drosophila persimilis]
MCHKLGFILLASIVGAIWAQEQPYYLQQCPRDEAQINECLRDSGNKLVHYLQKGVPELDIYEIEPVMIDEIGIVLGSGPDGYRALFRNIQAYGVSNITVTNIRSDLDSLQFQLTCEIPRIRVKAQYRSTGVLILVKASGAGDYWGEYEGVKAKIYFKAVANEGADGRTYLTTDSVKMDFNVKDIQMGVDNIANGNSVIQAALNLFINSNSQELLKEMKPALRTKLTLVIRNFMDRIFAKIPLDEWINLN